jgi:hypothetical protein
MKRIKVTGLIVAFVLSTPAFAKEVDPQQMIVHPDGSIHIQEDGDLIRIIRPGPEPTDTQKIFDRFGKGDGSRDGRFESASADADAGTGAR